VSKRQRPSDSSRPVLLTGVFAAAALGWLVAAAVGLLYRNFGLVLVGAPLSVFFLWGAWLTSPYESQRSRDRRRRHVNRLVSWLGIEWLSGPKKSDRDDVRKGGPFAR
jgi:hypothetical protein